MSPAEPFPVGSHERSGGDSHESSEDEPQHQGSPPSQIREDGGAEGKRISREEVNESLAEELGSLNTNTIEPEREDGNVEYKLKLTDETEARIQRLATQMRYRCDEGGSECIYRLGVEDDGTMTGLTEEEYESTIRCIKTAAVMNSYSIHNLTHTKLPSG
eukprot:762634-Prymnesium_polylepis.1